MIVHANSLDPFPLADNSVHTCVTSPPYWGLRSYLDSDDPLKPNELGLEATPQEYVARMVQVFREVKRVLRDDGTLWLNLGDSYVASVTSDRERHWDGREKNLTTQTPRLTSDRVGLPPKNLVGIPWRVAFALQADGWTLRSDIVWAKPNPMPESVTDRPTKSHEYLFIFSKAKWTGDYPPRRLSAGDARWLALLVETEGNIAIRRYTHKRDVPQHAVQVAVANSDRTILEMARQIAGSGSILEREGTNRPMYYLQWTTKQAANLLWEVLPYLFGKRQQALCALYLESRRSNSNKGQRDDIFEKDGRHYRLRPEELELRESIWKTVKALNQHEPVDVSWVPEPKEGRWVPERYYYDAEAVKEPSEMKPQNRYTDGRGEKDEGYQAHRKAPGMTDPVSRNRRSVWTIATAPFAGAHFATFPPALVEPCLLAGTSARGVCPACGAPWARQLERQQYGADDYEGKWASEDPQASGRRMLAHLRAARKATGNHGNPFTGPTTLGWQPTCDCPAAEPVPAVVLDPFAGSGTTGAVARQHGRRFVGLDINGRYLRELALPRAEGKQTQAALAELPLFSQVTP